MEKKEKRVCTVAPILVLLRFVCMRWCLFVSLVGVGVVGVGVGDGVARRRCRHSVSALLVPVLVMVLLVDDADIQLVRNQGVCLVEGRWLVPVLGETIS